MGRKKKENKERKKKEKMEKRKEERKENKINSQTTQPIFVDDPVASHLPQCSTVQVGCLEQDPRTDHLAPALLVV